MNRFWHVTVSELTKIRTVRSTTWALLLAPLITHFSGASVGHFSRPYGPWTSMAVMAAWVAAALAGGYLVLVRTDVSGGPRRLRWTAIRAG